MRHSQDALPRTAEATQGVPGCLGFVTIFPESWNVRPGRHRFSAATWKGPPRRLRHPTWVMTSEAAPAKLKRFVHQDGRARYEIPGGLLAWRSE